VGENEVNQDVIDRFESVQARLTELWKSMHAFSNDEQTIVVVPSMTLDKVEDVGSMMQPYEERFLFLLLLLRQPRARLVYVTSQTILPSIIDYYLDLLPGVIPSHARPRLFTVAVHDSTSRPLSQKILERPRVIEKIRSLIPDPVRAHLVPYNTTELERDLAVALGIPMYGADPKFFPLGTKSGCRRIFSEEGVRHPIGFEDLYSSDQVVTAIAKMRGDKPRMREVLVKLNEGVAGEGNGVIDLRGLPKPGGAEELKQIEARLFDLKLEDTSTDPETYFRKLEARGGIVEERIAGEEFRSPSVQLRVTPLGELEILSTHDQVLGGESGQTYLGCRFPADESYAASITREAAKVGTRLAREGVIGRFALDFVVVRNEDGWDPYAIEINLRKGGTTHPFLTLQFLTDGTYDPESGVFTAPSGRSKCFVASDHLENPHYRGLLPDDLFDIVVTNSLHFDQSRQTGVVFHMMSGLTEHGSIGLTAVGDDHEEAEAIYKRAVEVLDREALAASTP